MKRMVGLVWIVVIGACTTNNSSPDSPDPTETVSCKAPTITQSPDDNINYCKLDFGTCGEATYALQCVESTNFNQLDLVCNCEIDGVSGGDVASIAIAATSCAMASTVTTARLEQAWSACRVDMTIGAM